MRDMMDLKREEDEGYEEEGEDREEKKGRRCRRRVKKRRERRSPRMTMEAETEPAMVATFCFELDEMSSMSTLFVGRKKETSRV